MRWAASCGSVVGVDSVVGSDSPDSAPGVDSAVPGDSPVGCAGSAEVPAVDSTDGKSGSGISRCVLMHPARVSASRGERICLSFKAASININS